MRRIGHRPGVTTDEAKRIAELEREVKELRRANEILKTASAFFRRGGARLQAEATTTVLIDYIDQHREEFGVEPICTVLRQAGMPIAPSSYYAAKTRPRSARAVADERHVEVIRAVHADNYGVYGVRKMRTELNRRGHRIARCAVHRLMRAEGLQGQGSADHDPRRRP